LRPLGLGALLFSVFFSVAFCAELPPVLESIEVLQVSRSGRSLMLNRGHLEGLRQGSKARLLLQTGTPLKPELATVGYGEVIKSQPNQSAWYLHEIELPQVIKPGQRLVYILEERALKGMLPFETRQKKVILKQGKTYLDHLDEKREGMPYSMLGVDESKFDYDELNLDAQTPHHEDQVSINFDGWVEQKGLRFVEPFVEGVRARHLIDADKVSDLSERHKKEERQVFESYVQALVRTINAHPEGLSYLYQQNLEKDDFERTRKMVVFENTYQKFLNESRQEVRISPRAINKMERDNPLWSADMSDKALRDFMLESGLVEEERRQRLAIDHLQAHEFIFRYSSSVSRHISKADPNFQGIGYSMSLGYEYQLARVLRQLRSFTVDLELRRSIAFYEMAPEINGRFNEGSFGVAINYYFYNEPFSLNQLALYTGVGLKRGNADGSSNLFEGKKTFGYQMMVLPAIQFGAKYRFKAGDGYLDKLKVGMGLNFLYSFESKRLNTVESISNEDVNGSFAVTDNKFAVGLSFYF
jgi:hypothetical protein